MKTLDNKARDILEEYFGAQPDAEVLESLSRVTLRGGQWLFRQGDPGDSLYFLIRGRLEAWAEVGSEPAGQRLGDIIPGDSVGEAGLLTQASRSAGIRAVRDSVLLRLDRLAFESLAEGHPALSMALAGRVATLMQKNLSGDGARPRGFATLCLMRLHATPHVGETVQALTDRLSLGRRSRILSLSGLKAKGAPVLPTPAGALPESLREWLTDLEDEFSLLIYLCDGVDSPWTRFALRQCDMTCCLAEAKESPDRNVEALLRHAPGKQALILHHSEGQEIRRVSRWLETGDFDFHLHLREGSVSDRARMLRILSGTGTGLVLGSGAMRGLSELGVYKAMCELDIPVDWVGGSSIGAIVAGAIARDLGPDDAIALARESFVEGKPFSDWTLPVISLIRGRRMKRLLYANLDVNIEELPIPYFCVSSLLDRGEVCVHERGSLVSAIRASAALPGVLPPAVVESELVVDGAVLNSLPVDVMMQRQVNQIIAVDVSYQGSRQVEFEEVPGSWQVLRSRWLPFGQRYRLPGLTTLILRATEIGTLQQTRARGAAADLLINPPVRKFSMTNVRAFDDIVTVGYEHGLKALKEWKDSLPSTQ